MPDTKITGPSSLDGALNALVREKKISVEDVRRIREAAIHHSNELIGQAVENAVSRMRLENDQLRREKANLAVNLETQVVKAYRDQKAGGTITKEHFETATLPNYIHELCTSHRGSDRRTTWPILHFMDGRGFGTYNKMWNQIVGDQIINMMGKALLLSVRSRDILNRRFDFVAHVGGDEFCILETDVRTVHEGFESQVRFHHHILNADWKAVKEELALLPPQMDIGGVSIKSSSLRGLQTDETEERRIADRWYELGSIAMKKAKAEAVDILEFKQYDQDLGDFVDVPQSDLRYSLENRKGP